ncbi:MAG: ComF family protein [Alphaproteobacteria bacterium]|nr:ComF family protein [Alphaproteobacteria bacterium]
MSAFSWLQTLLNVILPPRCMGCGEILSEHYTLCSVCWKNCTFLTPPCCVKCGWPFPYTAEKNTLCPSCYRLPPLFVHCRSALAYQEGTRRLILKFKQGDGTYLTPGLGNLMLKAGEDILKQTDMLIPVPLHWSRLFRRQYNQATLLAKYISLQTSIPTLTTLLKRCRSTRKQGHQSRKERYANVRGAFVVLPSKSGLVRNKRITLIDDVFTTGATLTECTRTLLKAGAKEIRILTLARVITPIEK